MFTRETADKTTGSSETVIGSSVKIEGKFIGNGNVTIEGSVVGSLKTDHDLVITQSAKIQASVTAKNIFVSGEVHGTVKAYERLEVSETAKIYGDVEAKVISVGAGAVLNGKCTMLGASAEATEEGEKDQSRQAVRQGKTRPGALSVPS